MCTIKDKLTVCSRFQKAAFQRRIWGFWPPSATTPKRPPAMITALYMQTKSAKRKTLSKLKSPGLKNLKPPHSIRCLSLFLSEKIPHKWKDNSSKKTKQGTCLRLCTAGNANFCSASHVKKISNVKPKAGVFYGYGFCEHKRSSRWVWKPARVVGQFSDFN